MLWLFIRVYFYLTNALRKEASPFFVFHIPFVILLNKTERLQTSVCSRSQCVEKVFRPAGPIFRTL